MSFPVRWIGFSAGVIIFLFSLTPALAEKKKKEKTEKRSFHVFHSSKSNIAQFYT